MSQRPLLGASQPLGCLPAVCCCGACGVLLGVPAPNPCVDPASQLCAEEAPPGPPSPTVRRCAAGAVTGPCTTAPFPNSALRRACWTGAAACEPTAVAGGCAWPGAEVLDCEAPGRGGIPGARCCDAAAAIEAADADATSGAAAVRGWSSLDRAERAKVVDPVADPERGMPGTLFRAAGTRRTPAAADDDSADEEEEGAAPEGLSRCPPAAREPEVPPEAEPEEDPEAEPEAEGPPPAAAAEALLLSAALHAMRMNLLNQYGQKNPMIGLRIAPASSSRVSERRSGRARSAWGKTSLTMQSQSLRSTCGGEDGPAWGRFARRRRDAAAQVYAGGRSRSSAREQRWRRLGPKAIQRCEMDMRTLCSASRLATAPCRSPSASISQTIALSLFSSVILASVFFSILRHANRPRRDTQQQSEAESTERKSRGEESLRRLSPIRWPWAPGPGSRCEAATPLAHSSVELHLLREYLRRIAYYERAEVEATASPTELSYHMEQDLEHFRWKLLVWRQRTPPKIHDELHKEAPRILSSLNAEIVASQHAMLMKRTSRTTSSISASTSAATSGASTACLQSMCLARACACRLRDDAVCAAGSVAVTRGRACAALNAVVPSLQVKERRWPCQATSTRFAPQWMPRTIAKLKGRFSRRLELSPACEGDL